MCGIVGIISKENVATRIVETLARLEYRGYDSAGIATAQDNDLTITKVVGKVDNLRKEITAKNQQGTIGIGHTRWATHGAAATRNAHPFQAGNVVVVHNGIIENHKEIRDHLKSQGHTFQSDTDTEVIPNLIQFYLNQNTDDKIGAVKKAIKQLEGAYAVGIMFSDNDNLMIGVKRGAPLAVGIGSDEMYLGSDAMALSPFTSKVVYLEDDDVAIINRNSINIFDADDKNIQRPVKEICIESNKICKSSYEHFMLKEIYEQPDVLEKAYLQHTNQETRLPNFPGIDFSKARKLYIVACGTSYNSAMIAKYWLRNLLDYPLKSI